MVLKDVTYYCEHCYTPFESEEAAKNCEAVCESKDI